MTQRDESDSAQQLEIPVPPAQRRSPLGEACLKCGAAPGERCRTASGELVTYEHRDRKRLTRFKPVAR